MIRRGDLGFILVLAVIGFLGARWFEIPTGEALAAVVLVSLVRLAWAYWAGRSWRR